MTYQTPNTLESALELVAQKEVQVIAGGTDFYPSAGRIKTDIDIVDVSRIGAMHGVVRDGDGYRIGGATTWSDVIRAELPSAFDGLKSSAREVGSVQIQNAGTVAGNICNASPAADGVPPLLTLDAQVEMTSLARGTRILALEDFLQGVRKTSLQSDELVTAILIPEPPTGASSAFQKLGSRRYLVISIAMTAVVVALDQAGAISDLRIAVGACSPVARRLRRLEKNLIGVRPEQVQIDPLYLSELAPIDDVRGTAEFRSDVVIEQCLRAIKSALGRD